MTEIPHFQLDCSKGNVDVLVGQGFLLFGHKVPWVFEGVTDKTATLANGKEVSYVLISTEGRTAVEDLQLKQVILSTGEVLYEIPADTVADAIIDANSKSEALVSKL